VADTVVDVPTMELIFIAYVVYNPEIFEGLENL